MYASDGLNGKIGCLGKPLFQNPVVEGKTVPGMEDMITSCMEYFDPCRVFPASVDVAL